MGTTQILFWFLSALALGSALMVITRKNPVHSVLYLVLTFFAIDGHYVLLNAQFLAAVHIIVYAGAIMVLFLFVIMLLNLNKDRPDIILIDSIISSNEIVFHFIQKARKVYSNVEIIVAT